LRPRHRPEWRERKKFYRNAQGKGKRGEDESKIPKSCRKKGGISANRTRSKNQGNQGGVPHYRTSKTWGGLPKP